MLFNLIALHSLQDPSSPTRDWTWVLGSEYTDSHTLTNQTIPSYLLFEIYKSLCLSKERCWNEKSNEKMA